VYICQGFHPYPPKGDRPMEAGVGSRRLIKRMTNVPREGQRGHRRVEGRCDAIVDLASVIDDEVCARDVARHG